MKSKNAIVIIGPPGAGKGTQAKLISEKTKYNHITTGGLIRERMEKDEEFKTKYAKHMVEGKLLSDELILSMLKDKLKTISKNQHIVLDGVPRNKNQIKPLERILQEYGFVKVVALQLKTRDPIIIDRISGRTVCSNCQEGYHIKSKPSKLGHICEKCGGTLVTRLDDNPKSVKERLKIYHELTEPVINHYKKIGKLLVVNDNGRQNILNIHKKTMGLLKNSGIIGSKF